MASVAELVDPTDLQQRAGEYLQRAGAALRDAGRVRLVEFGPQRVTGEVDDDGPRSVVLEATTSGLRAGCDCGTPSANGLCPHVMAAAIEIWHRATKRS